MDVVASTRVETTVKRRNGRMRPASLWTYTLSCGHAEERVESRGNHMVPSWWIKCRICGR